MNAPKIAEIEEPSVLLKPRWLRQRTVKITRCSEAIQIRKASFTLRAEARESARQIYSQCGLWFFDDAQCRKPSAQLADVLIADAEAGRDVLDREGKVPHLVSKSL